MHVSHRLALAALVALTTTACAVSAQLSTSGADILPGADAGAPDDAGDGSDAASPHVEPDASSAAGEILGALSGSCGLVKTQLTAKTSTFERNTLTFTAGETYEKASLSPDAQRMFDTPNAGGTSTESEVMSLEVLRACEGAKLVKTESEIAYSDETPGPAKMTDILVEIGGAKVGVSVTRAYRPEGYAFSDADVKELIQRKLEDITRSSERVKPADRWVKQILHVFAANEAQADAVARILPEIDAAVRADTIVLLTQTTGGGFVYCNPDPPLGSECP